jgi:hypothetical protein
MRVEKVWLVVADGLSHPSVSLLVPQSQLGLLPGRKAYEILVVESERQYSMAYILKEGHLSLIY